MVTKLHRRPISVGGAAVYEYTPHLIEACKRESKYPDENGSKEYNLCRVVGGDHKRIWVPRNMAPDFGIDQRSDGTHFQFHSTFKPRNAEQERWIKECVALLRGSDDGFMARAPTGFGKTWCTTEVIARLSTKTIVVVNKDDIVDQWVAALEKCLGLQLGPGKGIGLIRGEKVDVVNQGVVIAMIQSISKEGRYTPHALNGFGLGIWDEGHRVAADFFAQSCFNIPAKKRMALSATPKRKDGRDEVIHAHIGPIKVWTDLAPMVPRVIAEETPWSCPLKRKTTPDGKLVMNDDGTIAMTPIPHTAARAAHVERMMAKHHGRNRMIGNFVAQAFKSGRKIMVQSKTREHLDTLSLMIGSLGVPPSKITMYVGGLSKAQREKAKEGVVILATYQMTKEATDIPEIDTLVMALPLSDPEQAVGRCIRYMEDKNEPLVFDLRDSTSPVFKSFSDNRMKFYKRIGAKVQVIAKGGQN